MKMIDKNDYITIKKQVFAKPGVKLNILSGYEITVKEKTMDYIILKSPSGLTEVNENGTINLLDSKHEIKINKGESKTITIPAMDYFDSVEVKY